VGSCMALNDGMALPLLKPALHCVERLTSVPHGFTSGRYQTGARKDSRSGLNTVEKEGLTPSLQRL